MGGYNLACFQVATAPVAADLEKCIQAEAANHPAINTFFVGALVGALYVTGEVHKATPCLAFSL